MNVDTQLVAGAFNLDTTDRGVRQILHDEVTDLPVLGKIVGVLLPVSKPP